MPRITCSKCEVDYVPDKSGVVVIDMFLNPPEPYKITNADRWVCPGCGHKVIAGFAEISHYYHETDFPKRLANIQEGEKAGVIEIQLAYEHPAHPDEEESK